MARECFDRQTDRQTDRQHDLCIDYAVGSVDSNSKVVLVFLVNNLSKLSKYNFISVDSKQGQCRMMASVFAYFYAYLNRLYIWRA